MQHLEERTRVRMLRLSAFLCAASLLLAPMAGRTSLGLSAERDAFDRRAPAPAAMTRKTVRVSLLRDPFGPRNEAAQSETAGMAAPSLPVVRAVATGRDAVALVDDAGTTRIVRTGDMVAGHIVIGIDARGVHFETGAVSAATENQQP